MIHLPTSSMRWRRWNNQFAILKTRMIVKRAEVDWPFIMAVIRVILLIAAFTMLSGCGSQYHLKRAIAKDPTILADTIVRFDTTIVTDQRTLVDTLVIRDTIMREIVRDGVKVRLQIVHDTIRFDVECPPDTIRVVRDVAVERLIYKEKKGEGVIMQLTRLLGVLVILVSIVIGYKVLK